MAGIFVAGTDTGVGKTTVSVALLHWLRSQGWSVVAMKPVASGCQESEAGLRNADALALQQAAGAPLEYRQVNPYAYREPVSPYLAARIAGRPVNIPFIAETYRNLADRADWVVVESVGGWHCPLTERETAADLALRLGLPVLLVVGLRLGCISHALLTERAIAADGLHCLGWVGNQPQPEYALAEPNLTDLGRRLRAPAVGHFPFVQPHSGGGGEGGGFAAELLLEILRRLSRSVTLRPFECADKPTHR